MELIARYRNTGFEALADAPDTELARIRGAFAPLNFETLPATSAAFDAAKAGDPAFARFARNNVKPHKKAGYAIVEISLKAQEQTPGDASADQLDVVADLAERYGLPVDPRRHIHALSVGERQRVEIIRCLLQNPRLLIMDEPTSVLTPQAVRKLFETLRQLAAEGCAILYISHKLDEIQALCHTATVLRGGKVTGECIPAQETPASMARLMIGKDLPAEVYRPFMGVHLRYLEKAFATINERAGSVDAYLVDTLKVDEKMQAEIRGRLIEA